MADDSTVDLLNFGQAPQYKHNIDTASATVQYNGYADPGTATSAALWLITRQTITGNTITIEFAGGARAFDQVWDDRASLSFS